MDICKVVYDHAGKQVMISSSCHVGDDETSSFSKVLPLRRWGGSSQLNMFCASEVNMDQRRYSPGEAQKSCQLSTFSIKNVLPFFLELGYVIMKRKYKKRLAGRLGVEREELQLLAAEILVMRQ